MIILPRSCPSFVEHPLSFPVSEGFIATNASVTMHNGGLYAAVNAIDQHVTEHGRFMPNRADQNPRKAALNRTYLIGLAPDLSVASSVELSTPNRVADTPWPFRGWECPRLFSWRGDLHVAMCSHGAGTMQGAKFFMGKIEGDCIVGIKELFTDAPEQFEKNWMPEVFGDYLRFHHRLGTLVSGTRKVPTGGRTDFAHLHGGSQVISFDDFALCMVHDYIPTEAPPGKQSVQHFVKLTSDAAPIAISERVQFTTHSRTEIATGMAHTSDGRMIISYGRDNADPMMPFQERPFIASLSLDDLRRIPYDNRTRIP